MSIPDAVKFIANGMTVGFFRYTPTSALTYLGFWVSAVEDASGANILLSKTGSTWTLDVNNGVSAWTGTSPATPDGGFSLTIGDWTRTAGAGNITEITTLLELAASNAAQLASDKLDVYTGRFVGIKG